MRESSFEWRMQNAILISNGQTISTKRTMDIYVCCILITVEQAELRAVQFSSRNLNNIHAVS